jgi:hypothetical protein
MEALKWHRSNERLHDVAKMRLFDRSLICVASQRRKHG